MSKSKNWPANDAPMDFESLTKPLVRAMRFAYKLRRQNRDKDIPWTGPEIGERERATCLSPSTQLSSENMIYSEDEQGRDGLEEIIGLALRIGIEQGRRITMGSPEIKMMETQLLLWKHGVPFKDFNV
jgi:hypothetical protein